ncbi:hypothetical protein GCM10023263_21430 [Phytohabitans rumicis]
MALGAGLLLAVGAGTALAGQGSETGAGASSAVQVARQVTWSVDTTSPVAFAGSLRTVATNAQRTAAQLRADGNSAGDYLAVNIRTSAADQLQLVVSATDLRVVGLTAPTSSEFFALDPNAPNFLPPPAGAGAGDANVSAARAADVPLTRRDALPRTLAEESAAAEDQDDAGQEDAGQEDVGQEDADQEDAGQEDEGAAAAPGIQDVLGAIDTLLQVVNGENVGLDQVLNAVDVMGQVLGLLLG